MYNSQSQMKASSQQDKTYTTLACCIKTYDYSESDKIIRLFSPEFGQISAIAKGVKKPNSKLSGLCELLSIHQVQLTKGKTLDSRSLHTVGQYEPMHSYAGLRQNLLKTAYGSLIAELILHATAEHIQDSAELFELLLQHLSDLNQAELSNEAVAKVAIAFQVALLEWLGSMPELSTCLISDEPLFGLDEFSGNELSGAGFKVEGVYWFSQESGGVAKPEYKNQLVGGGWIPVSAQTILALSYPDRVMWDTKVILKTQRFLQFYLTQILNHKIKAFDFVLETLA